MVDVPPLQYSSGHYQEVLEAIVVQHLITTFCVVFSLNVSVYKPH